jgi:ribosomal protein L9
MTRWKQNKTKQKLNNTKTEKNKLKNKTNQPRNQATQLKQCLATETYAIKWRAECEVLMFFGVSTTDRG